MEVNINVMKKELDNLKKLYKKEESYKQKIKDEIRNLEIAFD